MANNSTGAPHCQEPGNPPVTWGQSAGNETDGLPPEVKQNARRIVKAQVAAGSAARRPDAAEVFGAHGEPDELGAVHA
jgi:hypothetical protein